MKNVDSLSERIARFTADYSADAPAYPYMYADSLLREAQTEIERLATQLERSEKLLFDWREAWTGNGKGFPTEATAAYFREKEKP